jgi:glycosyltransferase involved in cell wall biosynthesis
MAKFSIVVPSLNQGRYIGESLESILCQEGQEVELFVLDGGSCDQSLEIIRRYSDRIAFWRSHPDAGQASAINEGFRQATGDVLAWLNSDDLYTPGGLEQVSRALEADLSEPAVCYGTCEMFREGSTLREVRAALPFDRERLRVTDFLDQPSVFWTRTAWELVGPLDETLHYAFDWDWFLRAALCCRFIRLNATLSQYRVHAAHKSRTGGQRRWQELLEVVRRHSSPEIIRHYEYLNRHRLAHWWLNKRMRVFQKLSRRSPKVVASSIADLLSPPFWTLPAGIRKEVLWQISGIR